MTINGIVTNCLTPGELIEKLKEESFLRYIAKKHIVLGDSILEISMELCGDKNTFIQVFVEHPELENAFYAAVEKQSNEETERLKFQAVAGAMRKLCGIVNDRSYDADAKDTIAASRAILAYSTPRTRGKSSPDEEAEDLYQNLVRGLNEQTNG